MEDERPVHSATYWIWTRRCGINERVHCRTGRAVFSGANEAVSPSILYRVGSVNHCSIASWSFFPSGDTRWGSLLGYSKKMVPITFTADWNGFCPFFGIDSPGEGLRCVMMDQSLIHGYETPLDSVESWPDISETVTRFCFCSSVNKRATHRAESFFMLKISCGIWLTRSSKVLVASAISFIFYQQLASTASLILSTVPSLEAVLRLPLRGWSLVLVQPRLNSLTHSTSGGKW